MKSSKGFDYMIKCKLHEFSALTHVNCYPSFRFTSINLEANLGPVLWWTCSLRASGGLAGFRSFRSFRSWLTMVHLCQPANLDQVMVSDSGPVSPVGVPVRGLGCWPGRLDSLRLLQVPKVYAVPP